MTSFKFYSVALDTLKMSKNSLSLLKDKLTKAGRVDISTYNGRYLIGVYPNGYKLSDNLCGRVLIDNIDAFIAIMLATEGKTAYIGEYIKCIESFEYDSETKFIKGRLYKVIRDEYIGEYEYIISSDEGIQFSVNGEIDYSSKFIKPNRQEIIDHFKEKQMRELKPHDAQRIIDIACPVWKRVLSKDWGYKIAMKEAIEISTEYYKEMRAACTPEQHKLLDEIFGPYRSVWKEINGKIILITKNDITYVGYYDYKTDTLYAGHSSVGYRTIVFQRVSQSIDFKTVKILS